MHVAEISSFVEQVFSSLERAAMVKIMPDQKGGRAVDYACVPEFVADVARGVPGSQQNELLPRRRNGHEYRPCQPSTNGNDNQKKECEEASQVGQ
jgi:hypothetical protein